MAAANTLGIIAGSGRLPLAVAEAARHDGRKIFVLALEGMATPEDVSPFPHGWASLGEIGKAIKLLKGAGCSELTLAGKVPRPEFTKLKLDARGALALPRVIAAAMRGDDALHRTMMTIFEREGMRIIGPAEAARGLLAPHGPVGRLEPSEDHDADILRGIRVALTLGALDVGQAAVVCQGFVLAVEAAEGTDAMLIRVASLPEAIRGTAESRRGVLVKAAKPHQERRIDLPAIGVRTVELAALAGLSGIAIEGGGSLVVGRDAVAAAADRLGLFVYGFAQEDYPRE